MTPQTLLRVPDLIDIINPMIAKRVAFDDIFRLIGDGTVKPLGYVHRMPVFGLDQIADIVRTIEGAIK